MATKTTHTYSTKKGSERFSWDVQLLWEASKEVTAVEWEIPESFLADWNWGDDHLSVHIKRCLEANLEYPVIIHGSAVVDGCHRIVKALALGQTTISAVLLEEMPKPSFIEGAKEFSEGEPAWTNHDLVLVVREILQIDQDRKYKFSHPADGF